MWAGTLGHLLRVSLVLNVADWVLFSGCNVYLVPEEIPNVLNAVVDHSGSLETQSPGDDRHILGQAHRLEHLWAEHT